jgi:hypothetical protein
MDDYEEDFALLLEEYANQTTPYSDDNTTPITDDFLNIPSIPIQSEDQKKEEEYLNYIENEIQNKNKICINEQILDEKLYIISEQIRLSEHNIINAIKQWASQKKKIRRDEKNQCVVPNRKGQRCRGYICKKSKKLCHAHRMVAIKEAENSHLYQKKSNKQINTIIE